MNIAFHSYGFSLRGCDIALFDYAYYNEELLGNKSIIIMDGNSVHKNENMLTMFKNRFGKIYFYNDVEDIDEIISQSKVEMFFLLKHGFNDGILSQKAKNCVQAVFRTLEEHGDVYAVNSEWLSRGYSKGKFDYVPRIINLPEVNLHFRDHLNIPEEAIVFGRYGGFDTFDIDFVHETVIEIAEERDDIYFLFMNTDDSFLKGKKYDNIKFFAGTADLKIKTAFIQTCDAMLHARNRGETFGVAIGEFSSKNKPVITFARSPEQAHYWHLKHKGIYYFSKEQLYDILTTLRKNPGYNYDVFSEKFSPERVMQRFKKVFIDD
ncbi:MAG: hypothetical protein PVH88_25060 [Ignavibacteria bacterium]|jgi:hypothetical protein